MSWAIGIRGALLEALRPRLAAWVGTVTGRAREPGETSSAHTITATASDNAPPEGSGALRLRPEVEKPLLDAGMPPEGSSIYDGRKRAADTPDGAARKFVLWARAVGATGAFSQRTIGALYWECAEVDHREPVAIDRFLRGLENAYGIRQGPATADRRQRVWIIDPAEPKRIPKARAPAAAKAVAVSPQLPSHVLQRMGQEQDHSSPQLLRATAHDARRQGRARKQRGSRSARWAA